MLISVVHDGHNDNVAAKIEMSHDCNLLEAITMGDKKVVEFLLDMNYRDVNECDSCRGDTPLHMAVRQLCRDNCWVDVVIKIIEAGGDITRQNFDGNTPVHLAFLSDSVYSSEVIGPLLQLYVQTFERKIPSSSANNDGLGIFHIACTTSDLQVLGLLLYHGFDREVNQISMKSTFGCAGYTPLHFAVAGSQQETVQILLSRGANVYAIDANNSNPLHLALQRADEDMIGILLPHYDFDIDMIDKFGYTNFMAACTRNEATFVIGYLQAATINYQKEPRLCMDIQVQSFESLPFAGYTPLHFAVASQSYEIVNLLLQHHNAHINDFDINCMTPLHLALYLRDQCMIDILLSYYEDFEDTADTFGTTHFMAVCASSEPVAVENFLRIAESSLNLENLINAKVHEDSLIYAGYTPLHYAVEFGNCQIAKLLLDYGANIYARDADRSTALHLALEFADTKMIDLILQYDKMTEDVVDNSGLTHFMAACAGSESIIVKEYLRVAEIRQFISPSSLINNTTSHERFAGYLPLHFAAEFGRADTVELLLMHNSDCCVLTSDKLTPLMLAEKHDDVRRVLQRNCDGHRWLYDAYLFACTYSNLTSDGNCIGK